MPDGLWRLDASEACRPRESRSVLLSPGLQSPPSTSDRGWLRAEVTVELPRGAALEVEYASTNDEVEAARLAQIAADGSLTADAKQDAIWSSLEHSKTRRFVFIGPSIAGVPTAIPLFESQDRWLWLRLGIVTPPGTTPPALAQLRVLHPDVSLVQQLPAAFRGDQNDPRGVLRRLVGVLETTTQGIDERIARIGRNIDPEAAPEEWLDPLGRWLDLPWDDTLPADAKRCILVHGGELLDRRGTRAGLDRLLRCLLGRDATVSIVDVTVDHAPIRLGGPGQAGRALPVLLAGLSPRVALLGGGMVMGRARLSRGMRSECDPLRALVPTVRIRLGVDRARRVMIEPALASVLAQYLPIGVAPSIYWDTRIGAVDALDADGPGAIGTDSIIGRTVLTGRTTSIRESGLDIGFRLT
jgi:phage tail-like protein